MTDRRASLPGPTLLLALIALGVGACQANPPAEQEPSAARPQQPEAPAPESGGGAAANDSTAEDPEQQQQLAQAKPAPNDPAPAADPPAAGSGSVEGNLYFVQTLIERSSMAQKVTASASPDALAKRDQARAKYLEARKASSQGDTDAAQQALNEAKMLMFQAARLADKDQVLAGKRQSDYQNRLGSVEALMAAHERVTETKGQQDLHRQLEPRVQERVQKAKDLAAAESYDQARAVLDEAYLSVKASLERLRGGDTLVRSLNFATKEEEYRYELDRNETLRMLVNVLLKERLKQQSVARMVDSHMAKAMELREEAEAQAESGDYQNAIDTLDASTRRIIRGIRSAGVYVPG